MAMKPVCLLMTALLLGGCSVLPYDDDFGCKLKNNYGKCIDSFDAYEEAVTGADKGKAIGDEGVVEGKEGEAAANTNNAEASTAPSSNTAEYENYRGRVYKQLSAMIDEPETPMVKPPKTVRTLILSYSPSTDRRVAYMPRYVYSMLEDASFVMTDYRLRRPDDQLPALLMGGQ
ncbi:TraV family lipoprotein (plasmid) [Aeromonas media]|uniref:TraV family lipoprotein n=1 Tax=Aeromonas caviae TaxID=648 RepID=A0A7D5UKS7_AERCA|nr:TraV family lipoprotein [Aeromonas caviae]QYK83547.1 TraV family lipoprotein [Aeromonas media]